MSATEVFTSAAVTAPHHLAAETGRNILAAGGNAVEAMVAMAAVIAVVYPHMNSLGGDGFWLLREPKGRVRAFEACGPAGARATPELYRGLQHDRIPARGPLAALTVPGAVGGWALALEYATSIGGRMSLRDLLAPAIRLARQGYPISGSEARCRPDLSELGTAPGFAQTFRIDGKQPEAGAIRHSAALANTLDHLASAGLGDFYRGDIAREIAADLERIGSPVTRADLERYEARVREPLVLPLAGRTLYHFPPPTQGLVSQVILGIYERLGVARIDTFEHVHGLIEAAKRAYALREAFCTDPAFARHDPASALDPAFLTREAAMISMRKAADLPVPAAAGDTIWMGAIDADGLAVSYIQSIFWEYGSGCVLPGTGLLMQNRGVSFSLDPAAVNLLQPGRKPFHTLNPALAGFADGRVMTYGTMGGDAQPQILAQLFTRVDAGQGLAEALDAPRFLFGVRWGAGGGALYVENRFDPSLASALERAGHEVVIRPEPYADGFGHAGAVVRDPRGHIAAAHDPRADGGAAGL